MTATPQAPPGRWIGMTVGGLALLVIGTTLSQVVAGIVIPPLAGFGVAFLVLALLLRRVRGRWLLIVVIVLTIGYALASIPFLTEDLPHPSSTGSFVPTALTLLGGIVTAISALMALLRPQAGGVRALAAVTIIGSLAIVVWSVVAGLGTTSEEQQPDDVVIVAENTDYHDVTAPAGVAAYVQNRDAYRHTFIVEGTDVFAEVPAGAAVRVPLELDPGSYRLFCDIVGHETMEATLNVIE